MIKCQEIKHQSIKLFYFKDNVHTEDKFEGGTNTVAYIDNYVC